MKKLLVLFVLFASCGGLPPNPDPIPAPTCTEVCAWWRGEIETDGKVGCYESRPTPNGSQCEEWCEVSTDIPAFIDGAGKPGSADRFRCILGSADCESSRQCE